MAFPIDPVDGQVHSGFTYDSSIPAWVPSSSFLGDSMLDTEILTIPAVSAGDASNLVLNGYQARIVIVPYPFKGFTGNSDAGVRHVVGNVITEFKAESAGLHSLTLFKEKNSTLSGATQTLTQACNVAGGPSCNTNGGSIPITDLTQDHTFTFSGPVRGIKSVSPLLNAVTFTTTVTPGSTPVYCTSHNTMSVSIISIIDNVVTVRLRTRKWASQGGSGGTYSATHTIPALNTNITIEAYI